MSSPTERHTISLIVRLWQETGQTGDAPRWRGQIQEVSTGETSHFQLPSALIDFLMITFESRRRTLAAAPPIDETATQDRFPPTAL